MVLNSLSASEPPPVDLDRPVADRFRRVGPAVQLGRLECFSQGRELDTGPWGLAGERDVVAVRDDGECVPRGQ